MRRRSNVLVILGLAFFLVGAAVVYLVLSGEDDNTISGSDSVEVVVAKSNINAGALGDDVITDQLFEVKRVRLGDRQADAITTPSQLSNQVLTLAFARGEQIRVGGLRPRSLLSQQVEVPEGFEAIAVSVEFVAGGAGYIAPGDKVNVFAVIPESPGAFQILEDGTEIKVPLPYRTPRSELLLTNIEILDVSQQVAPAVTRTVSSDPSVADPARAETELLTVLLAVATQDAEKIVYQNAVGGELYFSRVNSGAAPAPATPGQDPFTILLEEAFPAYQRSQSAP